MIRIWEYDEDEKVEHDEDEDEEKDEDEEENEEEGKKEKKGIHTSKSSSRILLFRMQLSSSIFHISIYKGKS